MSSVTGSAGQSSGLVPPVGYGVWGDGGLESGGAPLSIPVFGIGVAGTSHGVGVEGITDGGTGVHGRAIDGVGINAESINGPAVAATSQSGRGIVATSSTQDAVNGTSSAVGHAGVSANNNAPASSVVPSAFGLWASSANGTGIYSTGTPAAYFDGDVMVTGDVIMINSGDIAEEFDVEDAGQPADPGTVLVINSRGALCASAVAYDTRVAGVVSGAGDLRPGMVLHRIPELGPRTPVALLGKVYCKVDASYGPIQAGDLLTTSQTPGHAMRVSDRSQAVGAILGKALAAAADGCRMLPIMVSLR
jgi:hypothetical protein